MTHVKNDTTESNNAKQGEDMYQLCRIYGWLGRQQKEQTGETTTHSTRELLLAEQACSREHARVVIGRLHQESAHCRADHYDNSSGAYVQPEISNGKKELCHSSLEHLIGRGAMEGFLAERMHV